MTITQLAQKHNLEPESAKALNYDQSDPDKMKLPVGSKCGDCVHIRRCSMIYGHVDSDTYCDWSPSRFTARTHAVVAVAVQIYDKQFGGE